MRKYRIIYTCALSGDGYPPTSTIVRAYSKDDARERFFDTDDQDWEILEIKLVNDQPEQNDMKEVTKEISITIDGEKLVTFINSEEFEKIVDILDSEWTEDKLNLPESWFVYWSERVREKFRKA